ncbi:MAG TPA: universal stress protein [Patescibacteria group bacterium]|jgi:nucleotide-binding universal stress UspA family protein|nr:universal stress protein [Patescibacteria group bacterium]
MFKQILVALDGSPYSRRALPTAIEVAKKFDSSIFVLHVSEHDKGRAASFSTETPAEASMLVADAVEAAHKAGLKAAGEVRDAGAQHAARFIVDAAMEKGADLIVMGSRGLSDVQGIFLGSVTHKVIQTAEIPVLVDRSPIVKEGAVEPAAAGVAAVK